MNEFSISELAERAGVSVRTVRYYVSEGLLPSSEQKGRYSRYGKAHLDRLQLILHLKSTFLPLAEIRSRLSGLSDRDVAEILVSEDLESALAGSHEARDDSSESIQPIWVHYRLHEGLELNVKMPLHPWRERLLQRTLAELRSRLQDW